MSSRTRIFIGISLFLVFVVVVSFVLWNNARKKREAARTPISVNDTSSFTVVNPDNLESIRPTNTTTVVTTPKRFTPEEATDQSIKQLAKIFTERYGTYSTDNNFQNVKEVQDMVTPVLWTVIKPTDIKRTGGFVGVTTQAVIAEIRQKNPTQVVVGVKTIRNEERSGKVSTLQQTATVTLVQQGNRWLVDKFVWEK